MTIRKFKGPLSVLVMLAVLVWSSISIKALPGDPDESYGATGFYVDNVPITGNQESTVFLDGEVTADGKLTSVGVFSYFLPNFGFAQDFYIQRILPNGVRDTSFGNGTGSVRLANVFPPASQAAARAVRIQQDNKIVVAGVCNIVQGFGTPTVVQTGFGMCAVRLLPSGALDTSFGGNNFVVQHIPNDPATWVNVTMPPGTTFVHYPGQVESGYSGSFGTVNAAAYDVAIHSDGRIVLAGHAVSRDFSTSGFLGYNHFATIVTLTPAGALSSRDIVPPLQGFETARRIRGRALYKVETQSDGSVVGVGYETFVDPETLSATAHRWLAYTGSINGNVTWTSENLPFNSQATSVKFTRDNKVLVGGIQSGVEIAPALMRFNANLVPDTGFGSNGKIVYCRISGCDSRYFLANVTGFRLETIQNDGKILGLGGAFNPHSQPLSPLGGDRLYRFNPDGSVDRSFGNAYGENPNIFTSYGFNFLHRFAGPGIAQRIEFGGFAVLQPDGKILSGGAYIPAGGQPEFAGVTRRQNTIRSGIHTDVGNDGRSDIAVFRPAGGIWHTLNSFDGSYSGSQWGASGDKIAPADYDGDGRTDQAVFRNGNWYILRSSDQQLTARQWGSAGDLPRPGDFNGDGYADIAVFRPSNGTWYILYSSPIQPGNVTFAVVQFGAAGDVPLLVDFDGDGKSDVAVFRGGVWYSIASSTGQVGIQHWGIAGDVPVTGDYDADSKTDLAVFRSGAWYIRRSSDAGFTSTQWGTPGDVAVPGDYDNDGRTDIGVYRNGTWYVQRSSNGQLLSTQFGVGSDIPLAAAYLQ